jgi:hypothetical protein
MQRSNFAARREKGPAPLFSFGVGKVRDDGRVPIPESHSKEEREQGEDSAEEAGKPIHYHEHCHCHTYCRRSHTLFFLSHICFFKSISTQDSKIHERMDNKHSGPIFVTKTIRIQVSQHYPS